MNDFERALHHFLDQTFNDFYMVLCPALERGEVIIEHAPPTIHHAFYRLLCRLVPGVDAEVVPYAVSLENDPRMTLFLEGGVQVTIVPWDNEIQHTDIGGSLLCLKTK